MIDQTSTYQPDTNKQIDASQVVITGANFLYSIGVWAINHGYTSNKPVDFARLLEDDNSLNQLSTLLVWQGRYK